MTFFVISMNLSASLVQNQNNKSKINRNPPSYFLKRDGGFAYVISKPKKQKQVSTLQKLRQKFINIANIRLHSVSGHTNCFEDILYQYRQATDRRTSTSLAFQCKLDALPPARRPDGGRTYPALRTRRNILLNIWYFELFSVSLQANILMK